MGKVKNLISSYGRRYRCAIFWRETRLDGRATRMTRSHPNIEVELADTAGNHADW
jgi:hypothetical protein